MGPLKIRVSDLNGTRRFIPLVYDHFKLLLYHHIIKTAQALGRGKDALCPLASPILFVGWPNIRYSFVEGWSRREDCLTLLLCRRGVANPQGMHKTKE